jgi:hypothetical protein
MELAGGSGIFRPMRQSVDRKRTSAANPFPTVVIKRNGFFSVFQKLFVKEIEHLEERAILGHPIQIVHFKLSGILGSGLSPNLQLQFHPYNPYL